MLRHTHISSIRSCVRLYACNLRVTTCALCFQHLGITVSIRMRFQLNLEVRKAVGIPFSGNLEDGSILPLIWIDTAIEDLPESTRQMLYLSHYLVNAVEAGLQWCSLIGAVISFGALLAALRDQEEESIDAMKPTAERPTVQLDRL